MKKYKFSKYIYVDDMENMIFLYNTYTLDMVKMKRNTYEKILTDLTNDCLDTSSSKIGNLIEKKYLIPIEVDENRLGDLLYMKTCHSNSQLVLTILPTEGCNFRCEYCYEEHKQNIMSKEKQDALIKFVRRNLKYYGGLSVSWFGGEPLLYPEIIENLSIEFKKICKSYKKPFNAIMTTNGYLLDFEMFERMKKCNVTYYQITLDGMAEIHDKQRYLAGGQPTFDIIVKNLKEIKEREKSKFYTITIRTNLTVQSLEAYPKFAEFIKTNFLDDGRFSQRIRVAWNGTNSEEYEKNIISNLHGLLDNGETNLSLQESVKKSLYKITDEKSLRKNFLEVLYAHYPCYAAKANSFIFGPDGRVFKCTVHFDDSKDGVIGVLNDDGQIDINEDIEVKWITQTAADDKAKCYECVVYPLCQGVGCPYKMSVQGRDDIQCKIKVEDIISTFRIFSANEELCKNIEEM